jgi:VanZ family protein
MALIFYGSTDVLSVSRSSRLLGPFLHWLLPGASDATIGDLVVLVRKNAHALEYAILAALCWRALRRQRPVAAGGWRPADAWWAWLIAAGYAVTDEFHQSFVPSRGASPVDMTIDAAGAALGIGAIWLFGRLRRRW